MYNWKKIWAQETEVMLSDFILGGSKDSSVHYWTTVKKLGFLTQNYSLQLQE